jgi:hypothetical protein
VNFIDEQERRTASGRNLLAGFCEHLSKIFDARRNRAQLQKSTMRRGREQSRESRLPTPRRSIKKYGPNPIGFDQTAQKFARSQKMLLPDKFIHGRRAHPRRKWLGILQVVRLLLLK